MAAKSTTAGTPVKSCNRTRAGLKGTSISYSEVFSQLIIFSMSEVLMLKLSQLRIALSKSTLTLKGSLFSVFLSVKSLFKSK